MRLESNPVAMERFDGMDLSTAQRLNRLCVAAVKEARGYGDVGHVFLTGMYTKWVIETFQSAMRDLGAT